ncbi:competence/damage-inducible protein A [Bartonella sp. HY406]|uniref:competence/damage-inducible protein A n=1 Tax=Bartonella sp. HY406 TaxID=2979331 RepID=UPI0021C61DF7|nr:competence/damage-inducible protein A [Bartonella sp. HY406]UXN02443.1 competence/damage-inducible protein A [Bartonella sp. HY406]
MNNNSTNSYTAAMLAIGDELLSGRTKDKNIALLAETLTQVGIELKEVRIVGDEDTAIIAGINALRAQYDYVFTSGGIGPTHDDITAESISKAFDLPCIFNPEAELILSDYYKERDVPFTPARRLMTRTPQGASLIANSVSAAPGFKISNVFVLAGVPNVFNAMLNAILPSLDKGTPFQSISINCPFGEGVISQKLGEIQKANPQTIIGSYPKFSENKENPFSVELVIKSKDATALDKASAEVLSMIKELEK